MSVFKKCLILCSLFVISVYGDLPEEDRKIYDYVARAEVQVMKYQTNKYPNIVLVLLFVY